ncbi:hypothetical protein ACM66B_002473 [Microbotryomycetes sp. NB124-2]
MGVGGLSIESLPAVAHDEHDNDLFARQARLVDVTDDGLQVFSRESPDKDVATRLMRIWQERGDFSKVTRESILAQRGTQTDDEDTDKDKQHDDKMSVAQVKALSNDLMEQLALARTELATALDLLSVIAPLTDPPTVDVDSLPLAPETLTVVPTVPPPPETTTSGDPNVNPNAKLSLAISLASIKSSAASFFAAADALLPPSSPPPPPPASSDASSTIWPTLLHLRAASPYTLVPLGAAPGASLSGKGEARLAKQVGVFYGFQEANEQYRRGSVAKIRELVDAGQEKDKEAARRMILTVQVGDTEDSVEFASSEREIGVEGVLASRRRAAFAEELFAFLSNEIRKDGSSKARLVLGKRTQGDKIVMEGFDWSFTLTMLPSSVPFVERKTSSHQTASVVLPLLRLLFLQEYASRRRHHSSQAVSTFQQPSSSSNNASWSRPILQTLSAFLTHRQRLISIVSIVEKQRDKLVDATANLDLQGHRISVEYFGALPARTPRKKEDVLVRDAGESVERVLRHDKDLGGYVVFRATKTVTFQISWSTIVPHIVTPQTVVSNASHQPLTLHVPSFLTSRAVGTGLSSSSFGGGGGSNTTGVPVSSLKHLETFLAEHVDKLIAGLVKE